MKWNDLPFVPNVDGMEFWCVDLCCHDDNHSIFIMNERRTEMCVYVHFSEDPFDETVVPFAIMLYLLNVWNVESVEINYQKGNYHKC